MNREQAVDIFKSALKAVDPYNAVMKKARVEKGIMTIDGHDYDLNKFDRILIIGAGKGTAPMARAIEDILGDRITRGVVIVKYGHTLPLRMIAQIEASHPLPDEAGIKGAMEIADLVKGTDEKTLVIALLSGGASSLLVSPCDGISLSDKKEMTGLLLKAGATIDELNTVRKHISKIKGGRLAEMTDPATLITLALSDVIGDRPDVIASGPTVPDNSTFKDAMDVIKKYGLYDRVPPSVSKILEEGLEGKIKETPKEDERFFKKTRTIIVGSIKDALFAAAEKAGSMDFKALILTSELQGEAQDAARYLALRTAEIRNSLRDDEKPVCLLSGGETTVTVKGTGLGGRNQEMALAFAINIEGKEGIIMLSAGTDGTDGPTDAAGAIVDGETAGIARRHHLDPALYLDHNDSYHFFSRLDLLSGKRHHLITGPTGTNVMDMQIIMIRHGGG